MKSGKSLQSSLLIAFGICLGVIVAVQLAARLLIELPELYEQEYQADVHAAMQLRRAFEIELASKTDIAMDGAQGRTAYDALGVRKNSESLGLDLEFIAPADKPELTAAVTANPHHVLPRDDNGAIHWLIDDVSGQPLILVSQGTPPRSFDEGLLSASNAFGFTTSALLLFGLSLFVSRHVIRPIVEASGFFAGILERSDFSKRLKMDRQDELGIVANHFDELMDRVQLLSAQLHAKNSELEKMAVVDALTAVHNRRAFDDTVERNWRMAIRNGRPLACIMIDIDCFKAYNDHYGHRAGDKVLQSVAKALERCAHRATDYLCRYGGEEFSALLIDMGPEKAREMAERMVSAIRNLRLPHERSDCADVVTISAGVTAFVPQRGASSELLIEAADQALYEAKKGGRNRSAYRHPHNPGQQPPAIESALQE